MTEVTDQIPHENEEFLHLHIDQCIISNYARLSDIYRGNINIEKPIPKELHKTYPKPFIYYHYTEDDDHYSKIKNLLGLQHESDKEELTDYYTDDDAECQYLSSNTVSFLILGKPEIGQTQLARLLSERWKCLYISPESVIHEEINSDTRPGKCIKYNLESGRSVGPEVILRLVEKRIKSETAQHRGYVISGFPLLKNELYQEDPISSESAVFNVQEIFEDLIPAKPVPAKPGSVSIVRDSVSSAASTKDTTRSVEDNKMKSILKKPELKSEVRLSKDLDLGPSDMTIVTHTEPFHSLADPQEQLNFLKGLLGHPLIIIYVMCGTFDVRNKRLKYRYDIELEREFFNPPNDDEETNPEDLDFIIPDFQIDGKSPKVQVKLPMHFKSCISSQLWQYKCHVHNHVKSIILEHNPEHFIKVDGRLTSAKMFNSIVNRLQMFAFHPVLLPQRIGQDVEEYGEYGPKVSVPQIASLVPQEAFHILRNRMIIGPMYKFQLSNWAYKCPVALKDGRCVDGKSEFAVQFMNKIFFLHSEDALLKFYRNPRPYIYPVLPNPTCRIWVVGPKCSGKSIVSKCLAILLNCKILNPEDLELEYIKRKEADYVDKLRIAAITEKLAELNDIRQQEREEKIKTWEKEVVFILEKHRILTKGNDNEILNMVRMGQGDYSLQDKSKKEEEEEEGKQVVQEEINFVKQVEKDLVDEKFKELCLPKELEIEIIEKMIMDKDVLLEYLPEELKAPVEPATVFDSFVYNYVEQVGQTASIPDMSLSIEEKIEMFKTEINQAEEEFRFLYKRLGGWIIDGMSTDMEILKKLAPHYLADDVIYLYDDDKHKYLLEKFSNREYEQSLNFNKIFEHLKKESKVNTEYKMKFYSSTTNFIKSIIDDIHDLVMLEIDPKVTEEDLQIERNEEYALHLSDFLNQWSSINSFLEDYNIFPTEMNLTKYSMLDMLVKIVIILENKYRKNAFIFTEEERLQELIDFADPTEVGGEGMAGEAGEDSGVDFFDKNRRLGRRNKYCPVVYDRYFVLWKGKDEYAAIFEQQIYFLSSAPALAEFVENPRLFLTETPPTVIPPARICLIGTQRGSKSTLGLQLSENFGLCYVHYDTHILNIFNLLSNNDFEDILRMDSSLNPVLINRANDVEQIKRYIENGEPFGNDLAKRILHPLWFEAPYQTFGFVLDGYPRRPSDVEIMIKNFYIPDVVIEIHANLDEYITRLLPVKMELYRGEVMEKKRLKDLENEKIYNEWYNLKNARRIVMLEEKHENRRLLFIEENLANKRLRPTPVQSDLQMEGEEGIEEEQTPEVWFVYDETMEKEDIEEVNRILDEEMPEPIFNDIWEQEEETKTRVMGYLNVDYPREIENMDQIRSEFYKENIECNMVQSYQFIPNENFTVHEKYLYEMIRIVDPLKFRNLSIFERTYEINLDVAENLISQGYYFLSKFGRTCPVQVYENNNPIQMYFPGIISNNLYPVIYKRYIYFIYGEESVKKFENDTLKYVLNKNYKFPLIPFRIAVIGPPKCGKTTLVKRFSKEFNMKIISRGEAIRHVQHVLPTSDLAKNINIIVGTGWSVTLDQTARAVEVLTMHSQSLSQGYVLDGFPNTIQEMNHLKYIGIVPHIILDIKTNMEKIKEFSSIPINRDPYPTYSFEMIMHLFEQWQRNAAYFRSIMHDEYSNLYPIENLDSKWRFWDQAKHTTFTVLKEYQKYLIEKEHEVVLNVKNLCVTPKEFFTLHGIFLNYCPLCYFYNNCLFLSGNYPNRNCVFQYLGEYFFICDKYDHQNQFLKNPDSYLPPLNDHLLPNDLPQMVVGHLKNNSYQNGLCIVSFWDHQPKSVLHQGDPKYAVVYKDIQYLFCSEYCMNKFMCSPITYFNKIIHFKNAHPIDLSELNKLPTLGYFEQLSARILIDAIIHVEAHRSYYVGLNISKSAAIDIAIYLKRHNPKMTSLTLELYNEAQENLDERRQKLKRYLAYFKGRLNPFIDWKPRHELPEIPATDLLLEFDLTKWMEGRYGESQTEMEEGKF